MILFYQLKILTLDYDSLMCYYSDNKSDLVDLTSNCFIFISYSMLYPTLWGPSNPCIT